MQEIRHEEDQESRSFNGGRPSERTGPRTVRWRQVPDAFWRVATLFSFIVNFVLIVVLLVTLGLLFDIKNAIAQPLVGGLYTSFVQMDNSRIVASIAVSDTIQVNDTMPVVFDLPLTTNTVVTLTQETAIPRTIVFLNGLPVPTDIVLPAGTPLAINLNLVVPVSQTIPVQLNVPVRLQVPVDIPLNQTDLHTPFNNLRNLFFPYADALNKLPSSWGDFWCQRAEPLCGVGGRAAP